MKNYSVRMIRENMENIPQFPVPEGFAIRNYRRNEGHIWTRIVKAAEPYIDIDDGLFDREFGHHLSVMTDRSFYLTTDTGEEIGTTTAWWQDVDGEVWGQIHWVAVHPDYQGQGLSKPLMSVAMARLKQAHERCFLGTSTGRIPAVKVYLDFGFIPDLSHENAQEAWTEVASVLEHPLLTRFASQNLLF
jgi:GNAT superfamily N-acetyltransferase